jgi:hypothetical protein
MSRAFCPNCQRLQAVSSGGVFMAHDRAGIRCPQSQCKPTTEIVPSTTPNSVRDGQHSPEHLTSWPSERLSTPSSWMKSREREQERVWAARSRTVLDGTANVTSDWPVGEGDEKAQRNRERLAANRYPLAESHDEGSVHTIRGGLPTLGKRR